MTKTLEQYFVDWESHVFGFGYGSGEPHIIAALKTFLELCRTDGYDYAELERALAAPVVWLLINALCRHKVYIIDYGISPRYGWLTPQGGALKAFCVTKTVNDLIKLVVGRTENDIVCYPTACNCGPKGYKAGRICQNPFWPHS